MTPATLACMLGSGSKVVWLQTLWTVQAPVKPQRVVARHASRLMKRPGWMVRGWAARSNAGLLKPSGNGQDLPDAAPASYSGTPLL